MSVTLTIDESLLRAAERATDIHDWPTLVKKGLQALCEKEAPSAAAASRVWSERDFAATLEAAAALPDLTDGEFDAFEREIRRPLPAAWFE